MFVFFPDVIVTLWFQNYRKWNTRSRKDLRTRMQGMILEDDPECQLTVGCDVLSFDIENEIIIIHSFIRDKYPLKFPELESAHSSPYRLCLSCKKIGNEMDFTLVNLDGLLPAATITVVSMTASTTSGILKRSFTRQ